MINVYLISDYKPSIENRNYVLLFKLITKRCPNLLKIEDATLNDEILQTSQFEHLLLLPRLTILNFDTFHARPSIINTLNQLPNLRSVEFFWLLLDKYRRNGVRDDEPPSSLNDENRPDLPKLNVPILHVHYNLEFWRFCNFEHLQQLTVSSYDAKEKVALLNKILLLQPTIEILRVKGIQFSRLDEFHLSS